MLYFTAAEIAYPFSFRAIHSLRGGTQLNRARPTKCAKTHIDIDQMSELW